ncbi:3-phosphoshikimate 1-carboxyvinyltransferase [Kangiella spongicola]|uniref:3-phosphoshikimate 1-carboxyvinyltransferase n=1 Tax=Kangiella spongicola TaxID=796379 RepID=A0A318D171_9GAMM|nr:3-phosphoshikimate 1-carboxyvinyltransferase [Kangiella spongicola]PXF62960.1 3-phosphoshikimate 1-carboxyvinyltransferase [Kangiella spongicola]
MTTRKIISHSIQAPTVTVPGSKYLANRYIVIAALAGGVTTLRNLPQNDDIEAALEAVSQLGARVSYVDDGVVEIEGITNFQLDSDITINCRDSGTLSRFITAVASNMTSDVVIDASEQMKQRPMDEVSQSLRELGVVVDSDKLPIRLRGPILGGVVELDTSRSSQYLSGLLIACLRAESDTRILLKGKTVSSSYIQLTKDAIARFGGVVSEVSDTELLIPAKQQLRATEINVASDVVSSSYFMAAGLLAETSIRLESFDFESPQGESQFYMVLEKMGAEVVKQGESLVVGYKGPLKGIDVDMGDMPDVVPTLVVLALFAEGKTNITNIAHLAFKESNRIVDLCDQLNRLGANIEYSNDSIHVSGGQDLQLSNLSSCHDHRLAMSFALIGIRLPGVVVEDAQAVEKSFPLYWEFLEKIGVKSEEL